MGANVKVSAETTSTFRLDFDDFKRHVAALRDTVGAA